MTRYWLHDEPVGTDYLALVAFCAARSSGSSFALQNEEQFSPLCFMRFFRSSTADFVQAVDRSEWPGTRLSAGKLARLYFYETERATVQEIASKVERLYLV
jgi:hypothetical protein